MNIEFPGFRNITVAVAVSAPLLLAACAPLGPSSPEQLEAHNPTVTYKYLDDNELVQTSQLAATFCSQYRLAPRSLGVARDSDGNNIVNFECVPTAGALTTPPNSNLTYTYRSDQELLDISRNAQNYCLNNGGVSPSSSIVSNADGTKTITFQCNPR